jgi:predicted metal-dependent phosphoesterase TrpH
MRTREGFIADYPRENPPREEFIRFDMHIHSVYSGDSAVFVAAITGCFFRHGILPLVCDHNTISGSVNVYTGIRNVNPDIPNIFAEEIMTSDGEIIGLFLEEEIPPFLTAEETLDLIRDQGALSIVPHPFCSYRSSVLRHDVLDRVIDRIDIMEGYNARVIDDRDNLAARHYADCHKKPVSAGSDAHTPIELGRTWVEVSPFSTPREFMKVIPGAVARYRHMHPSVHIMTRLVKAGRRLGLFSPG